MAAARAAGLSPWADGRAGRSVAVRLPSHFALGRPCSRHWRTVSSDEELVDRRLVGLSGHLVGGPAAVPPPNVAAPRYPSASPRAAGARGRGRGQAVPRSAASRRTAPRPAAHGDAAPAPARAHGRTPEGRTPAIERARARPPAAPAGQPARAWHAASSAWSRPWRTHVARRVLARICRRPTRRRPCWPAAGRAAALSDCARRPASGPAHGFPRGLQLLA